jgi:CRISPR-associated endonuclease/helicase Cas3
MAGDGVFSRAFQALTGIVPLSWQVRLYEERFVNGNLPSVIDIPTGLGKTMVMAIWLIARSQYPDKMPTRSIYVVDRRTVVDQATDLAQKLRDNCKGALGIEPPAISTLRGQLADNREWSRDPSRPAIIIGTVDLIGSALLFSGYRSSYKRRPLEAGLLGQDSLLVLDEAHLSKPFEELLGAINQFNKTSATATACVKPTCVIRMSATSLTDSNAEPFQLEGDLESRTGDFADVWHFRG